MEPGTHQSLHQTRHGTAALAAGISPKVISERLGHATAAFTLQVYSHVIPGMDEEAATSVAALILSAKDSAPRANDAHLDARAVEQGRKNADLGESPGQRW